MSFKSNDGGSGGIRLNKCISSLSRRAADDAIAEGRVTVNGKVAETGCKVKKGDIIKLDGKLQKWEALQLLAKSLQPSKVLEERSFVYLKYWKPFGVTCTSDMKDDSNIIKAGNFNLFPQRIFTVGRLDKDSTGLILLTSDGRVNNAMLRPDSNKEKTYIVELDKTPSDQQIKQLADGVVITTISQREKAKPITAKTRPCKVLRIGESQSKKLEFILTEGRNRQIRKMVEAIGCNVITLHRTSFAGIGLKGLSSGNWLELNEKEMEYILKSLKSVNNLQFKNIEDMNDE
jgi:pseudouridine synthase